MFGFRRPMAPQPPARSRAKVPPGQVVWAIGDIHGRVDLLRALIAAIWTDFEDGPPVQRTIVFLGDYVDRGPASKAVLDTLVDLSEMSGIEIFFLSGNHENCMLAFMDEPEQGPRWCEFGGRETLRSYEIEPPQQGDNVEGWQETARDLKFRMPQRHQEFLRRLRLSASIGDYFFAHAGARPGVLLHKQSDHDLMWIRNSFLNSTEIFDQVVVHGHTPTEEHHSDHRRIGIDTGAYASGKLTALRLEGTSRQILQTQFFGGTIQVQRTMLEPGAEPIASE